MLNSLGQVELNTAYYVNKGYRIQPEILRLAGPDLDAIFEDLLKFMWIKLLKSDLKCLQLAAVQDNCKMHIAINW